MAESPYIAPNLTLRVGVTGHRPDKLAKGDVDIVKRQVTAVFKCLAETAHAIQQENDALGETAPFAKSEPELRLVTALAEGADRICAEAAISEGYRLNVVLPFLRNIYSEDFDGEAQADFDRLCAHSAVQSLTELDVSRTPHDPKAYHVGGLLMLDHSDILVTIWDGGPSSGLGGTAEIVEEAQRRGLILVLISPEGEASLWSAPVTALNEPEHGEWIPLNLDPEAEVCSKVLSQQVKNRLSLPVSERPASESEEPVSGPGAGELLNKYRTDRTREKSWAFLYELLKWICGARPSFPLRVDLGLSRNRQNAWSETLDFAEKLGGEDFAASMRQRVQERWIRADNLALFYSHKFRTAFIFNFMMAFGAVFIGLMSVLFWESKSLKAVFVFLELLAIGSILWMTRAARKGRWRDNWLDYRSLAEALRPARLPFIMASSPIRAGVPVMGTPGATWTSWYMRTSMREIAPPTAIIGANELKRGLSIAIEEEIDDQIQYHTSNAHRLHKVEHRLEQTADAALYATIIVGVLYILLWIYYHYSHVKWPVQSWKPFATLLSGSFPVLGAALFGIRATADFRSAISQSQRMVAELGNLRIRLEGLRGMEGPDRGSVRQGFALLSRTMADDMRVWGLIYSERDLTQGF